MKTDVIGTALPLVYRRGNEFEVLNGLDLSRKDELWGIQLTSGVMVALKCGSGNNVSKTTWEKVKRFAEKMRFEGEPGFLPSKDVLIEHWDDTEKIRLAKTVYVLKENKIEADGYEGIIWCSDEVVPYYAYYFKLKNGDYDWGFKDTTYYGNRVAVAFRKRNKNKNFGMIPTALPLVYRRENEFEVLKALDLSRKDELWGIRLTSGVMVALKCGPGNNVSSVTWEKTKNFAEKMRFHGIPGFLPSRYVLEEYWGRTEEAKFAATVAVLRGNDIEADRYRGCIWCSEGYGSYTAYCFDLSVGLNNWGFKTGTKGDDRVAVAFPEFISFPEFI